MAIIDLKTKFGKAILFSLLIFIVIAVADFLQYPDSFWLYSFFLGITVSGMYYIFNKDLSESLAVFSTFFIMLIFGLEDFVFYLINTVVCVNDVCGFPESLTQLENHSIIGGVSDILGLSTVTPTSLFISIVIGGIISLIVINYLKKQKTW